VGPLAAGRPRWPPGPDERYIVDELGDLTFTEVDHNECARRQPARRASAPATEAALPKPRYLSSRSSRSKLGARILLLNTDSAGPQLAGVLERSALRR
jgi:hypothetical protein